MRKSEASELSQSTGLGGVHPYRFLDLRDCGIQILDSCYCQREHQPGHDVRRLRLDRLLRARRGILEHAGGEKVFGSFGLDVSVLRKKIRSADVFAERIRAVAELLVRLRKPKPCLCELQVDLNGFSEFDDRFRKPLLFELPIAVVQVFFLGDGRIFEQAIAPVSASAIARAMRYFAPFMMSFFSSRGVHWSHAKSADSQE